jgi:hypothetical protein
MHIGAMAFVGLSLSSSSGIKHHGIIFCVYHGLDRLEAVTNGVVVEV